MNKMNKITQTTYSKTCIDVRKNNHSTTCSCKYIPEVEYEKPLQKPYHFVTNLCFQTIGNTKVRLLE